MADARDRSDTRRAIDARRDTKPRPRIRHPRARPAGGADERRSPIDPYCSVCLCVCASRSTQKLLPVAPGEVSSRCFPFRVRTAPSTHAAFKQKAEGGHMNEAARRRQPVCAAPQLRLFCSLRRRYRPLRCAYAVHPRSGACVMCVCVWPCACVCVRGSCGSRWSQTAIFARPSG